MYWIELYCKTGLFFMFLALIVLGISIILYIAMHIGNIGINLAEKYNEIHRKSKREE